MKFLTSLILGLTLAASALAGKEGGQEGHGGRVWFCKDTAGNASAELLDYYLARTRWGLTIQTETGGDEQAVIANTLARLRRLDPSRTDVYLKRAQGFMARANMVDENDFPNVPDVKEALGSRDGCELKLIVHQNTAPTPFHPAAKKFLVSRKNWESLDAVQKAGVILHEIILEDNAIQGTPNADGAMYTNALTASTDIAQMDLKTYVESAKQSGFKGLYQGDLLIALESAKFGAAPVVRFASGAVVPVSEPTLPEINTATVHGQRANISGAVTFGQSGLLTSAVQVSGIHFEDNESVSFKNVTFGPNQTLGKATLVNNITFKPSNANPLVIKAPAVLTFGDGDQLSSFTPIPLEDYSGDIFDNPIVLDIGGKGLQLAWKKTVTVTPAGAIRSAMIASDFKLNVKAGNLWGHLQTIFDDTGKVIATVVDNRAKASAEDGKRLRTGAMVSFFQDDDGTDLNLEGTPVVLLNDGAVVAAGIFNPNDLSHFIHIVNKGKSVGFRHCQTDAINACTQIGKKDFYTRHELRRHLNLSLKVDNMDALTNYIGIPAGCATGCSFAVAGVIGAIHAMSTSEAAILLIPASIGAGAMVGVVTFGAVVGASWLISDLPFVQKRRAVNRILRRHYLFTDHSIDSVRDELEKSLATVQ